MNSSSPTTSACTTSSALCAVRHAARPCCGCARPRRGGRPRRAAAPSSRSSSAGARARRRPRAPRGRTSTPRRRGVPTLARIAAMIRWALSPSSLRGASALVAASIPRAHLSWLASQGARRLVATKRAPGGRPSRKLAVGVRARRCPPVRSCCSAPGWCSPCTRTPPRRRRARRAPSCEGPRSRRARSRRRRSPAGGGGPCRASSAWRRAVTSAASFNEAAAWRSSFCVFLSSVTALTGPFPFDIRVYALRADSNAVRRLSRSSSSSTSRCTYSL